MQVVRGRKPVDVIHEAKDRTNLSQKEENIVHVTATQFALERETHFIRFLHYGKYVVALALMLALTLIMFALALMISALYHNKPQFLG